MHLTKILPTALAALSLAACGSSPSAGLDEAVTEQVNCLAAKTVITITDAVRDGLAEGKTLDELSSVDEDAIKASVSLLKSRIKAAEARDVFEAEVARRLTAIQNSVQNPGSADTALMEETIALAAQCKFEGA